jgi:hypothetical protein
MTTMAAELHLFDVNDDACGCCLRWDEKTWMTVWAPTWRQAAAFYLAKYQGDPLDMDDLSVQHRNDVDGLTPARDGIHEESRAEVLRRLGYACECESACAYCGLYPMDDERFALCDGCESCPECGCKCGQGGEA